MWPYAPYYVGDAATDFGVIPGGEVPVLNPQAHPVNTERLVTNVAIGAVAIAVLLGVGKFVFKIF